MALELRGTEVVTVEVAGRLPAAAARRRLGAGLAPELTPEGDVPVSLLLFAMRGLRPAGALGAAVPGMDYGEALWRIGVISPPAAPGAGMAAWFAHTCDLDHAAVRALGRWLVRYPVRAARLAFGEEGPPGAAGACRVEVAAAGLTLRLVAVPGADSPPAEPPRRVLAARGARRFEIPWREEPAPYRRRATLTLLDRALADATLGAETRWSTEATLHRGRTHLCGLARRAGPGVG